MAFPAYQYGYQAGYYQPPVPDQLAALRQAQIQQPVFMPQQTMAQQPAPPGAADDRIWVQGEGAATSYLVAANGFVRLWDSTAPVFYEKRADAQGKPLPMEIFDYSRRGGDPAPQQLAPDYEARLADLEKRLAAMEKKRTQPKQKEAEGE